MKVEYIKLENKEYIIVDKINIKDKKYYILATELPNKDMCIRKEQIENDEKYLVGLDDDYEFDLVVKEYLNKKKSQNIDILPIGSIVDLHDCDFKVMITGYLMRNKDNVVYDYCGCECPIGLTNSKNILYFDRVNITGIRKIGYINNECKNVLEKIKLAIMKDNL